MITLEKFIDKYHAQLDSNATEALCKRIEDELSADDANTLINMFLEEDFDIIAHLKELYPVTKIFNEFVFIEDLEESISNDFIRPINLPENKNAQVFGKYLLKNCVSTGFDIHNVNSVNAGDLIGKICALHIQPYLYENMFWANLIVEDEKANTFELLKLLPADKFLTCYSKIGYGCDPDAIDKEFDSLQKTINALIVKYDMENS